MRKLFFTSIAFSILSFILFGITTAILGRSYDHSVSYYETPSEYLQNKGSVFIGDYTSSGRWTILNQFANININSAGIDTVITRGEGDKIKVRLDNPANRKIHVEAVYTGNDLTIEARSANITFLSDAPLGLVNWLEDIFTGGESKASVIIEFPESKYDNLNIQQGSGSMKVHDLYADRNNIHIGSGSFEFLRRAKGFVASSFDVTLGSGSALISGMQTDRYAIEIGSGSFEFNDLSGEGHIDMGSGKGTIAYKTYNGNSEIDFGSGSLTLYLPDDGGAELYSEIGSGSIDINAYGLNTKITSKDSGENVAIGSGNYQLNVDMGSGHITIRDRSAYTEPVIEEIVIISDPENSVISGVVEGGNDSGFSGSDDSGSSYSSCSSVATTSTPVVEVIPPEAPDAPDAPDAPGAPDAPSAPDAPDAPDAPKIPVTTL